VVRVLRQAAGYFPDGSVTDTVSPRSLVTMVAGSFGVKE
jgi:hypothetical protein